MLEFKAKGKSSIEMARLKRKLRSVVYAILQWKESQLSQEKKCSGTLALKATSNTTKDFKVKDEKCRYTNGGIAAASQEHVVHLTEADFEERVNDGTVSPGAFHDSTSAHLN